MSNTATNPEQGQLVELSAEQANPGLAKPTDFKVSEHLPDHGQYGDSAREYSALLAEAPAPQPIPDRNVVPID